MNRQIKIEGEIWQVTLSDDKQLSFSYLVPREKSTWKKNPLWFDWHEDNNEDEWSYSMNGVSKIHPIKLKNALFKLIVSVIKESKTTSFYFKPTNKQRGNIYSILINKLLSDLGPEWTTQNIDNKWFYYNKN